MPVIANAVRLNEGFADPAAIPVTASVTKASSTMEDLD